MVTLFTDGAAKGNPGRGGYGLVLLSGSHRKELSEGYRLTTNNRMELLSVIIGLETLKKEKTIVSVYSDSKYVVDAVEKKWVFAWEKKNFGKKKNPDLWIRFLKIFRKHVVNFIWVKGIPKNESIEDTFIDIAGYAIIGLMLANETFTNELKEKNDGKS